MDKWEEVKKELSELMAVEYLKCLEDALQIALEYGAVDGGHHKEWVIDQMVRAMCLDEETYQRFINKATSCGFKWSVGIAP